MAILIAANHVGIGCANWVLRAIIQNVAEVLVEQGNYALAAWLTDELSPVQLYTHLDVRDLTPENQQALLEAVGPACERSIKIGPEGWHEPAAWPGFVGLFSSLAEQIQSVAKGVEPTQWPNLSGIDQHDGVKSGPGW